MRLIKVTYACCNSIGSGMSKPYADYITCSAVEMLKAEESISNQPQKGENHD